MKKYLFLLVGLLAFATNGPAEAKAFKLGRNTLHQTNGSSNPIANNDNIITSCSTDSCRKDGTCIKLSDFSCSGIKTTDSSGNCLCKGCSSGQYAYNNQCISFCSGVTCNSGNTPVALSDKCCCESVCSSGNVWHTVIGKCVPQKCVANCGNCSPDYYCLQCNKGHYLSYTDGTCPACSTAVANCSECTSSASGVTCTACESGYALRGGECVAITPVCPSGEVYHPVLERCMSSMCISNCAYPYSTCDKQLPLGYCPRCASGYYMEYSNGSCPACSSAIKNCTQCTSSCSVCSKGVCTQCAAGDGSGKGDNYITDNYITNVTCTACATGYTLRGGQCVSSCPSGQVYHPTLNRCVDAMCPANCADADCGTKGYCTRCVSGYYLNNEGLCSLSSGVGGGVGGGAGGGGGGGGSYISFEMQN